MNYLLADMSETLPIGAGIFRGYQPQVTSHLFTAVETLRRPDDEHESKCGQRTHSGIRHQTLELGQPLTFLLHRRRQLLDRGVQTVEQFEQVLSASAGPRSQQERLQLLAPSLAPPVRLTTVRTSAHTQWLPCPLAL